MELSRQASEESCTGGLPPQRSVDDRVGAGVPQAVVDFEDVSPTPRATALLQPSTPGHNRIHPGGHRALPRTPSAGPRVRTYSCANLFSLSRASSVPSFADLEAYTDQHSVTTITAEFARAYLQARKLLKAGAVKFPVVRSADGAIVDCGNVNQWKKGVAPRVVSGELVCSVVTFVRNVNYEPSDPNSALFTEHAITVRPTSPRDPGAPVCHTEPGSCTPFSELCCTKQQRLGVANRAARPRQDLGLVVATVTLQQLATTCLVPPRCRWWLRSRGRKVCVHRWKTRRSFYWT